DLLQRLRALGGEQLAEFGVSLAANRGLQAHRHALGRAELLDVIGVGVERAGELLHGRLAAELRRELPLLGAQPAELLAYVHRDADGPGLVLKPALHGL